MTVLNQKLTKYFQKTLDARRLHGGKNTYVRTWGLKRGEGVCSKGVYFRELTVSYGDQEWWSLCKEEKQFCNSCMKGTRG